MNAYPPHPLPQDAEVLAYIAQSNAVYPPDAFQGDMAQARYWYNRFAALMAAPFPDALGQEDFSFQAAGHAIAARRYWHPERPVCDGVQVLYVHGGGFVLGGLDSHADVCAGLCELTGLQVVASTYRLAPEHRHPAQLDDVECAYLALTAAGAQVILCGDSAGANLIAGLGVRLQSRGAPPALGQVLIYPGLGGDDSQGSYISHAHAPMLTTQDCAYYFSVRTEGLGPAASDHAELRPLRATDLSGMPPTLIVTADIDPLRDDGVHFAQRLQAHGVRVAYRNEPELVHGYLRARHMSQRAAQSFQAIADALLRMAQARF